MLTPYQKSALDYKSNILLTANAGSGKTFVLSKRFVEILLNGDASLENIVAITFTDKAAGELNKKIANEVEQRLMVESDNFIKRKLEDVRRQLVSANISTIHSFCVNILREFAPEAGIDANFIPIDQITADEILELAVDELINNLINNPEYEAKLKYLIRFFGSKRILEKHLKSAVDSRKIIDHHLKDLYSKSEALIAEYFKNNFEGIFHVLFDERINEVINYLKIINDAVLRQSKNSDTALEVSRLISNYSTNFSLYEKIDFLKLIKKQVLTEQYGFVKNKGYLSKNREMFDSEINIVESFFYDFRGFYEMNSSIDAHLELARFGKNFIDIYQLAAELYAEKKHQRGYLDFEDILLFTQNILQLSDVQEYLRSRFKYIMIDEYQDTNELQYKIFMPILDDLKKGNLFVVGDEKQSIYMFRDAELEIFSKTKDDIRNQEPKGKILNLPHSFRMAPSIVLFTNKLFTKLFSNPQSMLNEVEYSELICAKPEDEIGSVEFLLADKEKEISEAELVANKIIEITSEKNKKVELKEIGILCRKRDFFEELESEFIKRKIPYTIVGGKGFYQRQIIYDVYNYLTFLINQNDDAALIGILRAPFYTISDTELFEISLEEGNTFFEKLIKKSEQKTEFKSIVQQLKEHIQVAVSTELYTLIRKILLDTNYWSVVASKKNSEQEIANLEKLISISRDFSLKSFRNLYDFVIFLRGSIQTLEDESQAQIAKDENTVKLLTIHQAKGLEFKAVFLYGCNSYAREDSVRTKSMSIDKNFGLLAKVPLNNNYFSKYTTPSIVALYNYINHKKNVAEIKRLLYVAVTRAMNFLYISAAHKNFDYQRDSFFQLLINGLAANFSEERIVLRDKIKFMKNIDNEYQFYEKEIELAIPIIKELKNIEKIDINNELIIPEKKFLIHKVEDYPKKEIFSATKISMFNQCPVKYELTYELGYPTIYDLIKKYRNDYEFNSKEDEDLKLYADVKGRVIHSVLKENAAGDMLDNILEKYLSEESVFDLELRTSLKSKIIEELNMFCSSKIYNEFLSIKNFKNEFEIYCEEGENYLYGIIDKLIYKMDKLIIVDYKTDNILYEQIFERAKEYFLQLQFYAYILSKYYVDYNKYELRLVFIHYPYVEVKKEISKEDLSNFREELHTAIDKIIKKDYKANLNHCSKCNFAFEGNKCIKSISCEY